MSRLDALPADQRSVLQLLLRQGKGYEDLSGLLALHAGEVRSRAYDALDALGPGAAGLPSDRRQAIADWLLGQQGPDEASATRAFVSGSPAGRAWADAVAKELRPLAGDRLPDVPVDGARAATPPPAESAQAFGDTPFAPAPSAAPRVSRRGGALLIGGVVAAVAAAVVLAIVFIGGGDDKGGSGTTAAATTTAAQPKVRAQINLLPQDGSPAPRALAIVQVVDTNGQRGINAVAQGLPEIKKVAYGIWAYSSPSRAVLIGGFNQTDNKGHIVFQGPLQKDISGYKEIVVTRETRPNPTRPGTIYLRGRIQAPSNGSG